MRRTIGRYLAAAIWLGALWLWLADGLREPLTPEEIWLADDPMPVVCASGCSSLGIVTPTRLACAVECSSPGHTLREALTLCSGAQSSSGEPCMVYVRPSRLEEPGWSTKP